MRRTCFGLTLLVMAVIILLSSLSVPLGGATERQAMRMGSAGEKVALSGKVLKVRQARSGVYRLEVELRTQAGKPVAKGRFGRREKVLLTYRDELQSPWTLYFQEISFQAALQQPDGRRNPGCFDYRLYLKSQGIYRVATIKDFRVGESALSGPARVGRKLLALRYRFAEKLHDQSAGLVSGLLFGDTTALAEEDNEEFRRNGTAHILAVSGLHIGILYRLYQKLAGKRKNWPATACLAAALLAYGTISLWSASVIRASLMIALRLIAQHLDLRYDMLTALSAVALLLMVQNPYVIFGAGFQLSFLAIASICFFQRWLPDRVSEGIAVALAVNLGLLPYQAFQFNCISLVALLANVPIIYLAGIMVPVALTAFCVFALCGQIGPFQLLLDSLSFCLLKINHASALGGFGSVDVVGMPFWLVCFLYFAAFFLCGEAAAVLRLRGQRRTIVLLVCCLLLCSLALGALHDCPVSGDDLVFVDVGQGDCCHVRADGLHLLIDGGGNPNSNIGKAVLKPYLLKNGAGRVDLALATHLHTDHYKGLQELAAVYPVKKTLTGLTAGQKILLTPAVTVTTLWPVCLDPSAKDGGQDENHLCSVFMLRYGRWKILITGDLDEQGEREMLALYAGTDTLKADILKVGHHGSKTSTSQAFLDAVDPAVAVIQVGAHNVYGHPAQKTIEKCVKKGIMVYRTDEQGAIGIDFGVSDFAVHTVIASPRRAA